MVAITEKKLIKQNNDLQKKLEVENNAYYEKLVGYMRTGSWFHDKIDLEELLLEILQDILSAQEEGVSAENFFGSEPKKMADELLSRLDMKWTEGAKIFGIVFSINAIIVSFSGLVFPDQGINLLTLILTFFIHLIGIAAIFKSFRHSIYSKKENSDRSFLMVIMCTYVLIIGIQVLFHFFLPALWVIVPSAFVSLFILLLFAVLSTWKVLLLPKEERTLWIGLIPLIWLNVMIGILNHWSVTQEWVKTSNGLKTTTFLSATAYIFTTLLTLWGIKKESQR